MTTRVATPRKPSPKKGMATSPEGTIRVTRSIAMAPPIAASLAKNPPAQVGSAPEQLMQEELPAAPGLPCSGRCGRCNYHPCRLHASV